MKVKQFQYILVIFCISYLKCLATTDQNFDLPIKVNGDSYNFVFGDGNFTAKNIWSDSGEVNYLQILLVLSTGK